MGLPIGRRLLPLLAAMLLPLPGPVSAADPSPPPARATDVGTSLGAFRVTPRLGLRMAELDLTRPDGQEAVLTDYPGGLYLSLSAAAPDLELTRLDTASRLALTTFLEFVPFRVDRQNYYAADGSRRIESVGTSAAGDFTYLAVALTVMHDLAIGWAEGDRASRPFGGLAARLDYGLGSGYSRLRAEGSAIFAPGRVLNPAAPPQPLSIRASGWGGFFFFLDFWLTPELGGGMRVYTRTFHQSGLAVASSDFVMYVALALALP